MLGQILARTALPPGHAFDYYPPRDRGHLCGQPFGNSALPRDLPDARALPLTFPPVGPPATPVPAEAPGGPAAPGFRGSPAGDWALAEAVLFPELPGNFPASLAAPAEGPGGWLFWRTHLEGAPRELEGLPPWDREAARSKLLRIAEDLSALGARLARKPPGPPDSAVPWVPPGNGAPSDCMRAAARLASLLSSSFLSAAAGVRSPEKVFVVDGEPVLAGWWKPPCAGDPDPAPEPEAGPGAGCRPARAEAPVPAFPAAPDPPAFPRSEAEGASAGILRPALAALCAFLSTLALFWLLSPGFRRAAPAAVDPYPSADGAAPAGRTPSGPSWTP
ncbi:MAG: hypothetical protein LBQ12_10730 [Deltaproteobacteria bacterium]|jgi:hypothetical protein|nr:hypothetical protein [Deltaproteobacteria bacterium]